MSLEGVTITEHEDLKIKLIKQQEWVEEKKKEMQSADPVLADSEPDSDIGTESWKANTHAEMVAQKASLIRLENYTKEAIKRMESGEYGNCDICGHKVEEFRMKSPVTSGKCATCAVKSPHISYQQAA